MNLHCCHALASRSENLDGHDRQEHLDTAKEYSYSIGSGVTGNCCVMRKTDATLGDVAFDMVSSNL